MESHQDLVYKPFIELNAMQLSCIYMYIYAVCFFIYLIIMNSRFFVLYCGYINVAFILNRDVVYMQQTKKTYFFFSFFFLICLVFQIISFFFIILLLYFQISFLLWADNKTVAEEDYEQNYNSRPPQLMVFLLTIPTYINANMTCLNINFWDWFLL